MPRPRMSRKITNPSKKVGARLADQRVSFKNTRETALAIKKMSLLSAKRFLNDVLQKKQAIPFCRYNGGIGRHAQAKLHSYCPNRQVRWPIKSVELLLSLLKNAEANAIGKKLCVKRLEIQHIQVSQATKIRRRTYRAHGRINPYMSSPCHVQIILNQRKAPVRDPKKLKKSDNKEVHAKTRLAKANAVKSKK
eukprot:TRINITY_DN953_c0_g6_i1.p1 TRINITY_DN953_c0_g6~~TRINITY_DN953_c0_g6_i1.p1  ORF type:complete len:193 (+),score=92.55 TRINITY_DN953_c0_g6_i1:144-722(+)